MEQRVLEFKKHKNIWYSGVDVSKLNERIYELQKDGWRVISITPTSNWLGIIKSYSLLLQSDS